MITVNIGRTFLNAYNRKYQKQMTAKQFFEEVYFELFFNHDKYLNWYTNSEFVQGVMTTKQGKIATQLKNNESKVIKFNTAEDANKYAITNEPIVGKDFEIKKEKDKNSWFIIKTANNSLRLQFLYNHIEKVDENIKNQTIDYSIAIGFPASEIKEFATTSGLISDIDLKFDTEDIYLSWIGSGLSIGVAGGLALLFDQPEILLSTFEGWQVYRQFLNEPSLANLAGNKITSWNGQWLSYRFSNDYRPDFDYASLNSLGFFKLDADKVTVIIDTIKWSKLFFNLSKEFPEQTYTAYIFSLGQTNKTMGFYPFKFQQAKKLITFYKKLFGENEALKDAKFYEEMYGLHIKRACELGAIGLQALEPEGLRKYFDADKIPNLKKSVIQRGKDESDEDFIKNVQDAEKKDYETKLVPFRIYKTWLLAMITKNNEQISDYTQMVAKAISEYRANDKAGSKKRANIVQSQLFAAKTKKGFLEAITEIIFDAEDNLLGAFKELRDRVHLMNNEDFGYFVVLLKFDYAYNERIS